MRCKGFVLGIVFSCLSVFSVLGEVKDKPVADMKIVTMPSRTTFNVGEDIDLTGLLVNIRFTDGEEYVAKGDDFTVEGYDSSTEGSQLIVLRYGEYPLTLGVNVRQGVIQDLQVRMRSTKSYFIGDHISQDDFVVTVRYDTGTTRDVTDFQISSNTLNAAQNTISVTYGGTTRQVNIAAHENVLQNITIDNPGTLEFTKGEGFNSNGLVVIASYLNGSKVDVTNNVTVKEVSTDKVGNYRVEVSYKNMTAQYVIAVVDRKFDHLDVSSYAEDGTVSVYFVGKDDPVIVSTDISVSDDQVSGKRTYSVLYCGKTYTASVDIPEEERKYSGSKRVVAEVPVGITCSTDYSGEFGYVQPVMLKNKGEVNLKVGIIFPNAPSYLSDIPSYFKVKADGEYELKMHIENIKYSTKAISEYFPISAELGVE